MLICKLCRGKPALDVTSWWAIWTKILPISLFFQKNYGIVMYIKSKEFLLIWCTCPSHYLKYEITVLSEMDFCTVYSYYNSYN